MDAEAMEGSAGRQDSERARQRGDWFSFQRTLRLFACTCALLWFVVILVLLPSTGAMRPPPLTREVHTYITFLNVLIVLLAVRGWRAHLLFVPVWLALLWWLCWA
jgi:heme A synthase